MKDQSDEECMIAYQMGDEKAFGVLYERYRSKVYSYIKKRTDHAQEAEEIFQSVFVKLHHSRLTYQKEYLFSQWIFVVAKTVLLDFWKKRKREQRKVDAFYQESILLKEVQTEEFHQEKESLQEFKRKTSTLNETQRQAVEYKIFHDFSYDEIAQKMNTNAVNVRKLVSRGLERLRKESKKDE